MLLFGRFLAKSNFKRDDLKHITIMRKLNIIFSVLLLSFSSLVIAQNRISVSKRSPIYMELTSGSNAGISKKVIIDNSQWLNYTTLVHPADPDVSITVEVAAGSIPEGMELLIEASPYKGMSKGKQGTPTRKISVSNRPRVLIDNIRTSYTGSGRNEGHQLTFSFIITDYAKIRSGTHTIYVQYTITQ